MYKISVPMMNRSVNMHTRDIYLEQLKAAKAARVFLVVAGFSPDEEENRQMLDSLRENIAFFEANGIEAAIWFAETIGHGGALAAPGLDTVKITGHPLVNFAGQALMGTHCPLDAEFRKRISAQIARLAETGAKTVLLDDDFRIAVHGSETDFLCVCDAHLQSICEKCGEPVSRVELKSLVFSGKANKYRAAWIAAQGDSLRLLAQDIRDEMDKVAPDVRIAYCTPPMWDIDGASPNEMAGILAGKHPPLARLCGAPYWAALDNRPLPVVFETARMYAALCKNKGVELMAEGDAYPRPRHIVPASYLELYDAVIRADGGYQGILKYMVSYNATPEYETGYLAEHHANLDVMEQISDLFDGKTACGVSVATHSGLLNEADLSIGTASARYPYALAGCMMGTLSFPTTYEPDGTCQAVFGEEARHCTEERLQKGAILDGIAAILLTERGIDVGLSGKQEFEKVRAQYLASADDKDQAALNWRYDSLRLLKTGIAENADAVIYAVTGGKRFPLFYRYQNAAGQRFAVYLADTMAMQYANDARRGNLMQDAMRSTVEWISGERLPAFCPHNPDLYLMCKRGEGKLAVGLFNCFADRIREPVIQLDRAYTSIRFAGCTGRLEGDRVFLDSPLHAFEFAAFEVG